MHPTGVLKTIYAELFDDYLETFNSVDRSSAGKPNIWSPGFTLRHQVGLSIWTAFVLSWHYYCWALNGSQQCRLRPVCVGYATIFGPMVTRPLKTEQWNSEADHISDRVWFV